MLRGRFICSLKLIFETKAEHQSRSTFETGTVNWNIEYPLINFTVQGAENNKKVLEMKQASYIKESQWSIDELFF